MASGDIKGRVSASSQLTISLAGLASDTNLLAGQQSDEYDNSVNLDPNLDLTVKITTGTGPTTTREIRVYVIRPLKDGTYPDGFGTSSAARTISSVGSRDAMGVLAKAVATIATSDKPYYLDAGNIAALFGFSVIPKFIVFVTHNTGVNLNATGGNHEIHVKGSGGQIVP